MAVLVTGSNKLRVTSAVQCSDQCTVLNQADRVRPQDSWCGFGIKWWLLCWQKNTRKKYDISRDIFKDPLGKSKFTFSANESVTARRCCDQSANQRPVFAPLNDQGVFPPRSHADWNSLTRVCCHLSPAEDAEDGRDGGSSLEFRSITLYFYSCNKTLIHNIMDSCPSTEGMRHSISDPKVWAPTDFPGCNPRPGRAGGRGCHWRGECSTPSGSLASTSSSVTSYYRLRSGELQPASHHSTTSTQKKPPRFNPTFLVTIIHYNKSNLSVCSSFFLLSHGLWRNVKISNGVRILG